MSIKEKLYESMVNDASLTDGSIDGLLEGFDDEAKGKLVEAFENAVAQRAKSEIAVIEEMYESKFNKLEESYESKFDELSDIYEEKFDEYTGSLDESIDGYLGYVSEQFIKQNALAIDTGLKTEIVEGFIGGLKGLFESSYIDIPESKVDVVSEQAQQIETLQQKLKEAVDTSIQYRHKLEESARYSIIDEFTAKLVDTDAERFRELAEELSYSSEAAYRSKLNTINEHYFNKPSSTKPSASFITDAPVEQLNESYNSNPSINKYVAAIDRHVK
jgi:hypothetical protein